MLLAGQQLAHIANDRLRLLPMLYIKAQPPLGVEYIGSGGMIDRVGLPAGIPLLLVEDFEVPGHGSGCGGIAEEPDKTLVEGRDILGEQGLGIVTVTYTVAVSVPPWPSLIV